ncbi:unnamed protein product [Fusarium graminearum]|uniref:Chromosome 4, complete genome n=1 Tax=Gibberella zeae (strain ATCC MYA-4620 / CBS 123657 / FGSC 9075 / NRRL 31084 / PH-1) TaxID=229533 RepID=A0A0E0SBV8_GIBZE|nr:hypothetical protein FG05_09387 [Fusarium graminearum]CEF83921.1 unnamed protein product [Fusarium graminearum]
MKTWNSSMDEMPLGGCQNHMQPPGHDHIIPQNIPPMHQFKTPAAVGTEIAEPLCRRTTFFVNVDWRMGATLATATNIVGQMYVECMEPVEVLHPYPVILIHGDFHTGQTTKPDGQSGWASFFLKKGFQVMIVDVPPSGRSNFLTTSHYLHREVGLNSSSLKASAVEAALTAPSKPRAPGVPLQYERAVFHNKWPGTGQRGDPIFARYCASLTTLHLSKVERQSLAQNALQALLRQVGKSILVGEGSGGNATWLAADVEPDLVAAAIAIEPVGPPFGTACPKEGNPYRKYSPFIEKEEGTRIYGLADIPITYDPPAHPHEGYDPPAREPLDLVKVIAPDGRSECFMQRRLDYMEKSNGKPSNRVRQLINIKKVPCMVVTAHASSHAMYDWAVVAFMMQAGVKVDWFRLEDVKIEGNGHLMFLETNSDQIAQVVLDWIMKKATPETFLDMPSSVPMPESTDLTEMIEQSQLHNMPSVIPSRLPSPSQMLQFASTLPTDHAAIEATPLRTPQAPSFEVARSRPIETPHFPSLEDSSKRPAMSSGQTTVSMNEHHESPHPRKSSGQSHKRVKFELPAETSTPSSMSSSLPQSNQMSSEQRSQPASQASQQQGQVSVIDFGMPDISMMRPAHPGGPARLRQQENRSTRSPLAGPAFSLSSYEQASNPFTHRPCSSSDELSLGQQYSPAYRENQRNCNLNNAHTTARFERNPGTAEESIAAMALNNPSRACSGLSYPSLMTSQSYRSTTVQPQQQIPYLGHLDNSPAVTSEVEFRPLSTPTAAGQSMSMAGPDPLFTPLAPFSGQSGQEQNHFGVYPQMTPPSPSPMPRQSLLNPLSYNLDTGSPHLAQSQHKPTSR